MQLPRTDLSIFQEAFDVAQALKEKCINRIAARSTRDQTTTKKDVR